MPIVFFVFFTLTRSGCFHARIFSRVQEANNLGVAARHVVLRDGSWRRALPDEVPWFQLGAYFWTPSARCDIYCANLDWGEGNILIADLGRPGAFMKAMRKFDRP